ncbi:hypothetical protein D9758_008619 [Tetrapyrgos nigripes]|uniref:GH18 domain-containing protein n=1 Tax=Tetrapyrgos nigripes TaxID=182062 RepID=A0A8H5D531_9AGAR|nr:hypothetical protein D9758_008619 [Tetrapyrgos nigripes]
MLGLYNPIATAHPSCSGTVSNPILSMISLFSSPLSLALIASSLSVASADTLATEATQYKPTIASAYFTGWHSTNATPIFSVSDISWRRYTRMVYAFAETTSNIHSLSLSGSNPSSLPPFVAAAHKNNVNAIVSIGGWTGSRFWSTAVGSHDNRTAFVKTVTDFATQYKLDGLDFDWEYPVNQGIGCNIVNPNDTANYIKFLKLLRQDPVGAKLDLSAAVPVTPYNDASGKPYTDMSEFAQYLDHIMIMNYDVWGPWSSAVGPIAPLNDTCAASANQQGSAVYAINAWRSARVPAHKIVLGLASYGYSYQVAKKDAYVNGSTIQLAAYPRFNSNAHPKGDSWDNAALTPLDVCGNPQGNGGTWDMWSLVGAGLLTKEGKPVDGIPYRFDNCSQTAYVYRPNKEIMISFDDPRAYAAKGQFIKDQKLDGFAMWEAGGDYNNILLDSVRNAAGF